MTSPAPRNRPNIVLILADDMGFSDIGAYGAEIRTPNLDRLGESGLRFTQMYNSARCCPTRASLLTGLNPQQAGVGHMVRNMGVPAYQGYLNQHCVTIAEVLRGSGYRTLMSGKWHVGGAHDARDRNNWAAGDAGHPTPLQRGFDRYFGILGGGGSYYNPSTLMDGDTFLEVDSPSFYLTDAISDRAVGMIQESAAGEVPFFLYVAYTSPHWPLHALEEDIARYEGMYRDGWDSLRTNRHEQQKGIGLLDSKWQISPRDQDSQPWEEVSHREWEAYRMAVYAAQVDRMDQGIGRITSTLREMGIDDNTLVMFLSDNGGCAEFLAEDSNRPEPARYDIPTVDGRPMRIGNSPAIRPGPDDTFMSYDLPWANASNAPFRLFKRWVHEGGISTPFIAHWPAKITRPGILHEPTHVIDVMATCLDAAGVTYPAEFNGHAITPLEGESLMPLIEGHDWSREQPICWEHEGNRALRDGDWKLVSEFPGPWELYNIAEDRTELNNLADGERDRVAQLTRIWEEWAARCGVRPWPLIPEVHAGNTRGRHDHIVL